MYWTHASSHDIRQCIKAECPFLHPVLVMCSQCQNMSDVLTCPRRQVEDKYSQHHGEDAGHDDVDDVEKRLPLNDEVESDVLVQVLLNVLSGGFVTDCPFSVFCKERDVQGGICVTKSIYRKYYKVQNKTGL